MYEIVHKAVEKARNGGPTLIEAVTYRLAPHSTADDHFRYRTREEIERWKKRDPIYVCRRMLERCNSWDEIKDRKLWDDLTRLVSAKVEEAEKYPLPHPFVLFEDVYSYPPWHLDEELDELMQG